MAETINQIIDFLSSRRFDPASFLYAIEGLTIKKIAYKFFTEVEKELDLRVMITSAREGKHSIGSLHYTGKAIDFVLLQEEGWQVKYSSGITEKIQKIASKCDLIILDEYADPSKVSTGGHFHLEYRN